MAHALLVGRNTYATEAEATAFLEQRLRSMTAWAALTQAQRLAALSSAFYLMESVRAYRGERSEVTQLSAVAVAAGGTGYAVNDVVELVGGTGEEARAKVTSVSSGVVTGLQLIHTGFYTTTPSGTLGTTTVSGAGSGLTVTFTEYDEQQADWPRSNVDVDGVEDAVVPEGLKNAQAQLAFELTQDSDLETATNANANVSSMQVGSLSISYFKSEARGRFPSIVWDLLLPYIGSDTTSAAPRAYGGDGESSFEDTSPSGITGGGY